MPAPRVLTLVAATLSAALATSVAGAAAPGVPCPTNQLALYGVPFTSTAASMDTTVYDFRVAYDLHAGKIVMRQNFSLGTTSVHALDDYDVAGVPAGTPVNLTVLLTVDGAIWTDGCSGSGCNGTYSASLVHGSQIDAVDRWEHLWQSGRIEHHDVLQLPITIIAGQPERIEFTASGRRPAGSSHPSEAFGTITFAGLPPGASVISCQGYGGAVTGVRTSTWGALKAIYR